MVNPKTIITVRSTDSLYLVPIHNMTSLLESRFLNSTVVMLFLYVCKKQLKNN